MRKVIAEIAVSLDGFIEGPNGELDWLLQEGEDYYINKLRHQFDTIFYGRRAYEKFGVPRDEALLVSEQEKELNGLINKTRKYVFSHSVKHLPGNGMVVNENLEAEVKRISDEEGKDIWLCGGSDILKAFIEYNLVDEYILALHPLILGAGKPLFQNLSQRLNLKLVKTKKLESGVVILHYYPIKA